MKKKTGSLSEVFLEIQIAFNKWARVEANVRSAAASKFVGCTKFINGSKDVEWMRAYIKEGVCKCEPDRGRTQGWWLNGRAHPRKSRITVTKFIIGLINSHPVKKTKLMQNVIPILIPQIFVYRKLLVFFSSHLNLSFIQAFSGQTRDKESKGCLVWLNDLIVNY